MTKPRRADLCVSDGGAGVYYILNTMSLRMRIGQTVHLGQRLFSHYGQLQCGTHTNRALQEDWTAFGEYNFEFGVLVTVPYDFYPGHIDRYLLDLEQHFMKVYRTKNPIYGYDFDQRPRKPAERVYEGFFARASRFADDDIARLLGEPKP